MSALQQKFNFFLISNYRCNVLRRTVMCGGFIITMKHTCVCVNVLYLSVDVRRHRRLKCAPIKNIRELVDRNISVTFPFIAAAHHYKFLLRSHNYTRCIPICLYMQQMRAAQRTRCKKFSTAGKSFSFLKYIFNIAQTNCVYAIYTHYRNLRNSWWFLFVLMESFELSKFNPFFNPLG